MSFLILYYSIRVHVQGVFDVDLSSFSDAFFNLIDVDENGKSI